MPETFQYTAVKIGESDKIQGTITAESERHARELLRDQELYPTDVSPLAKGEDVRHRKQKERSGLEQWMAEKLSFIGLKEKLAFTRNLGMMVKAGIPITEALLYMESYMEHIKFKRMLNVLRNDILAGYSFSRALAKHPKIFDDVYVSIIQAGESSGELEVVLHRLAELLLTTQELRKKVISAMIYPAIVILLIVGVVVLMFVLVIPTFTDIYQKMGVPLPLITKMMIGISDFMRTYWYICIGGTAASIFGFIKFASTEYGKRAIDATLLKIPVVNTVVTGVTSSHFISTLHVSFSSGLPITDCIFMACQTVTHTQIRETFETVNLQIQSGQRLASAFSATDVLPDLVLIMISTGEESGELESMLEHGLDYLEGEVSQRVDILMSMMEPVLLVVMGAVVLVLMLAVYLPLFGLYEQI